MTLWRGDDLFSLAFLNPLLRNIYVNKTDIVKWVNWLDPIITMCVTSPADINDILISTDRENYICKNLDIKTQR